jgi:hypothetical protein
MNGLTQNTNIQATITLAPFEDWFLEKTGSGCMITIAGTGEIIQDWGDVSNSISQYLLNQGWSEDLSYSAGGAGGYIQGYRNTDNLCILTVESKPINKDLCSEDEPIAVCWEGLTPDQKYYSATLNCAQDTTLYIDPEPVRIYFDTGAISDNLQGALAPSGGSRYVLMAMEGQEMSVDLQTDWPEQSGILIIWGVDGTVLLTDHGGASSFQGILPSTQDYYINIRSVSPYSFRYTLTVTIPPKQ